MNPYYSEWVRITGGGGNYDFMIWSSAEHTAFRKSIGLETSLLNRRGLTEAESDQYLKFLQAQPSKAAP